MMLRWGRQGTWGFTQKIKDKVRVPSTSLLSLLARIGGLSNSSYLMSDQSRPNMNGINKTFLYSRPPLQDLYRVCRAWWEGRLKELRAQLDVGWALRIVLSEMRIWCHVTFGGQWCLILFRLQLEVDTTTQRKAMPNLCGGVRSTAFRKILLHVWSTLIWFLAKIWIRLGTSLSSTDHLGQFLEVGEK